MREIQPRPQETGGQEDDKGLQIGDVAKLSGVTLRTLRYYEELGLIEPFHRTKGNFRLYHPGIVNRVEFITSLKKLDFSLDEIRDILGPISDWNNDQTVVMRSISALRAKQKKISQKLGELAEMNDEVQRQLSKLEHECIGCKAQDPAPCDPGCENKGFHLS